MSKSFGDALARMIDDAGYSTPTDFAHDAEVSPSSVSKWLRGIERPSMRKLEQIAPKLRVPLVDLVALAYPGDGGTPDIAEPRRLHPLAAEIDAMLADDSRIPADQREMLEQLIDHVVSPYRRIMRPRRRASGAA